MIKIVTQLSKGTAWAKVSKLYYKGLKKEGIDVELVDFEDYSRIGGDACIFIPLEWTLGQDPKLLKDAVRNCRAIIAMIAPDSDSMGCIPRYLAELIDHFLVPGRYVYDLDNYSVRPDISSVVHLPIDEDLLRNPPETSSNPKLAIIDEEKRSKILLVHHHDIIRKNTDLALLAIGMLKNMGRDIVPVVKVSMITEDDVLASMPRDTILIKGSLSERDWTYLLSKMDIAVVPSGGGACELVAVEACALGIPTVTTNWLSFLEYVPHAIHVPIEKWVDYPAIGFDKCIIGGRVGRVNVSQLVETIAKVLDELDDFKAYFEAMRETVLNKWGYKNVVRNELLPALEKIGVV